MFIAESGKYLESLVSFHHSSFKNSSRKKLRYSAILVLRIPSRHPTLIKSLKIKKFFKHSKIFYPCMQHSYSASDEWCNSYANKLSHYQKIIIFKYQIIIFYFKIKILSIDAMYWDTFFKKWFYRVLQLWNLNFKTSWRVLKLRKRNMQLRSSWKWFYIDMIAVRCRGFLDETR